jgi:hypothetical protein
MAVGKWLRMEESDFYCNGIFKPAPIWDKHVLELYVGKQ